MLIWFNSISKMANDYYNPLIITTNDNLQPLIIGNKYIKQVICIGNIYLLLLPITIAMFCRSVFVHIKSALFSITRVNNGGTCV